MKMADGRHVSLAEVQHGPVRSVSEILLAGAAFRGLAEGLREAAEGFMTNARRSVEAPIDPGVLDQLRGVLTGAEEAQRAAEAFLAAFDEHYGPDVQQARQGTRMDNGALTG